MNDRCEPTTFRECRNDDWPRLQPLYAETYPDGYSGACSFEHWSWKFLENPQGSHSAVAERGGDVVAFVGGVPMRVLCNGEERVAVLTVDHMTRMADRSGLKRLGLWTRLKQYWIGRYCGADRDFIGFGFPNDQNFRIGQHAVGYSLIRPINVLLHARLGELDQPSRGITVAFVDRCSDDAGDLWARCVGKPRIIPIRDRAYLDWRYAEHALVDYRFLEAREHGTGLLRGIAIVRSGGIAEDALMLMDWLVPHDDEDAAIALLRACANDAIEQRMGAIVAWFPESTPEFEAFQDRGFRVRHTPLKCAGRSWDRRYPVEVVRRDFHLSFGAMDMY